MWRDLREHIRYRVDQVFARESLAQFILLVVLVVVVTMIGMTAVFFGLFSPENEAVQSIPREIDRGFFDSLWWSLQQVLYLRHFERSYGATLPIVLYSLFLSLMGLAVFGTLVSLINTSIERRLERLRRGDSLVKERGHVLILGWSQKVFSILRLLAQVQDRLKVVILAPREVDDMHQALRVEGLYRRAIRIILRTGSPSNRHELQRVAFDTASSIIALTQDERGDKNHGDSDVIKTLMLLSSHTGWSAGRPTLTGEIAQRENYEVASIAGRGIIPIVSSSTIISKVIVQSIRYPGVSRIYSEIFSFDGNGIQVGRFRSCSGQTLGESAYRFHNAIPLGVAWSETNDDGELDHVAGLNPEPEYEIADDEQVILLARREPIRLGQAVLPVESRDAVDSESYSESPRTTLLIGWNGNIYDILSELEAHAGAGSKIIVLSTYDRRVANVLLERFIPRTLDGLDLDFVQGDAIHRSAFADVNLDEIDSIVFLADESSGESDLDARTIRTMLLMSDLLRRESRSRRIRTVVELLDTTDTDLLDGLDVDDVVISPEVVSAQLAQISREPILGTIYRELLSAGGIEIGLRPAGKYVPLGRACGFDHLICAAQQKLEIALGVSRQESEVQEPSLEINPPRDAVWTLGEHDRVIVLAQEVFR